MISSAECTSSSGKEAQCRPISIISSTRLSTTSSLRCSRASRSRSAVMTACVMVSPVCRARFRANWSASAYGQPPRFVFVYLGTTFLLHPRKGRAVGGIDKAQLAHEPRPCPSSRDMQSPARKVPMRSRSARSSRFNRSTSLSSAANSVKKRLTSAETDVSRSAAFMRARR
jgi:hypothetical protein